MLYKPERIYIESQIADSRFGKDILNRFADVEQTVVDTPDAIPELQDSSITLTKGKRILFLKRYQGSSFKLCPGFSEELLCCNYYVLDLIENCPLECAYCILQAFLNKPLLVFHLNVEEIIAQMMAIIEDNPGRHFRIGTGEHSDSLALDHIFRVNPYLVDVFSSIPNATLELKTKTDLIDPLLGLNHRGRTVIAWSLNPEEIIDLYELKTASLEKRLKAATRVVSEGYKVAFHFDPIIYYPDWRNGYAKAVEMLFDYISPQDIAWISLGTLRYIPALKQIAEERFPKLPIFCNEFVPAGDGKMRYLKKIRKELLQTLSILIRNGSSAIPLYLCMEKHRTWDDTMTIHPSDASALELYLNRNV